jgi:hypothetical protein
LPSAGDVGLALRTEKGALRPSVTSAARLAGVTAGHVLGIPGGELVGVLGGPKLADALIPKRPFEVPTKSGAGPGASLPAADEFYSNKADQLVRRGKEQSAIDRSTGAPATKVVTTDNGGAPRFTGSEGRPATWTNERVTELAKQGNREAIQQMVRRGMELPANARYVAGDAAFSSGVYNHRDVTTFAPDGTPIRQGGKLQLTDSGSQPARPITKLLPESTSTPAKPIAERRATAGSSPTGEERRNFRLAPETDERMALRTNLEKQSKDMTLSEEERKLAKDRYEDMANHPDEQNDLTDINKMKASGKSTLSKEEAEANTAKRAEARTARFGSKKAEPFPH